MSIEIYNDNNLSACKFDLYTPEEVENFGICIDKTVKEGLGSIYDLRLGATEENICWTCKGDVLKCCGHFGYIKLAVPILHPLFINKINHLLQLICQKCFHCIFSKIINEAYLPKQNRFEFLLDKIKKVNYCSNCMFEQKEIKYNSADCTFVVEKEYILNPSEIYFIFSNVPQQEIKYMGINSQIRGLIIFNLVVLPNPARPILHNKDVVSDDDLSLQYLEIIKTNNELKDEILRNNYCPDLILLLKNKISIMFNNSSIKARHNINMRAYKSIYERINGKEGQIRKNAISKRADKTARTVISPNPNLTIEEVGVPRQIAQDLTVPEYITPWNIVQVNEAWLKGEIKVVQKVGSENKIDAQKYKYASNAALSIGDIFWRPLKNGDYVYLNRQPTLHAPSIQGMRIVIYDCKTISINLSNCPAYNADMDGDEVNLHKPQSLLAEVECMEISSPKNWIISNASNSCEIALVQDSLLAAYLMTNFNYQMSRENWLQIAAQSHISPYDALLRHGSYSASLIAMNFDKTFSYKSSNIEIIDGYYISGVLNKSEIGYKASGLLYNYCKKYGAQAAINMLSSLQFVCTTWITMRGYSISIRDCAYFGFYNHEKTATKEVENIKKNFIKGFGSDVDKIKDNISGIIKQNMDKVLPHNQIHALITAGSKGNWTNVIQIRGIIGQQYAMGEKVSLKKSNNYADNGFIFSNYFLGLNCHEYFSQAIASREAICKSATGTSVSGYLYRKLCKSMENTILAYDMTIRDKRQIIGWARQST